ncbi:flagellar hook-associated protein 2 [Gracilibacillus ureilyticus]|uniref:Flagellar hook-associated protein 2 n=2 Tax=Gracilibacillus ureilyticus TaxID=531814 RepID=A0A1H9S9Z1_9BACI|nr:flagellar hook-associated protein 2 [Gracilibacillus ureilyticus]
MSTMRISGFASGMDIDTMVRDLMKAESLPLQKMQKEKQVLEWKRDDYRSMNTLLLDFKDSLLNMRMTTSYRARQVASSNEDFITATASSAANQTSYTISKVEQLATASTMVNDGKISDPNGEKVDATKGLFSQSDRFAAEENPWKQGAIEKKSLTASTIGQELSLDPNITDKEAVSIKVNGKGFEVLTSSLAPGEELADNQVLLGDNGELTFAAGVIQKGTKVSAEYIVNSKTESHTLAEGGKTIQLSAGSIVSNDDTNNIFNLKIGSDNYGFSTSDSTGNDNEYYLKNKNDGTTLGVINTETGKITLDNPVDQETSIETTYQQNYTHFSVNAHAEDGKQFGDFIIAGNESINQVVSEVNKANIGVAMLYDSFSDQLTLRRTETGNFNEGAAQIETNGTLINDIFNFGGATEDIGQNAKFIINGLETERYSNTFDIEGVTFNLKQTFDATDTGTDQPVSLNISNDSETVFENIKEFVETYNTLIDAVNGKVTETFYRDYDPLTDEQRESLTEKQQEDWEERAKSGLLRNDAILRDVLSSMRTDFYSPVDNDQSVGAFNQLAAIGITTTKDYMSGGKLEINEAKLKEAIEQDPDSVENLFRGGEDGDTFGEKGIARRLTDTVDAAMNKIYERAGRASYSTHQYTLGRNLDDMDKQIERFEDRLTQIEDRYWRQFTAMEQAIAKYNNQSSYLMQQFGGFQ